MGGYEEMLAVAQINYIRYEVNQKGDSYASVAGRMGIDPRTVSKYANQEEFKVKPKQKRKARVMDPGIPHPYRLIDSFN